MTIAATSGGSRSAKVSLTAKCLHELQMPFLPVFRSFQSHGLVQHPSMHCQLVAIANACLGDICPPTGLDDSKQGVAKGRALLSLLPFYKF